MATDVYIGRGIIAHTKQMVGILKKDDVDIVMDMVNQIDFSENEDCFKPLTDLIEVPSPTFTALKKALTECVVIEVVDGTYEPIGQETLVELWNDILSQVRPDLPTLDEVRCEPGNRTGRATEADFVFGSDDCFSKRLTKKGKALKEAIGHCYESEWTWIYYS